MTTTILLTIAVWIDVFAIILLLWEKKSLNRKIRELECLRESNKEAYSKLLHRYSTLWGRYTEIVDVYKESEDLRKKRSVVKMSITFGKAIRHFKEELKILDDAERANEFQNPEMFKVFKIIHNCYTQAILSLENRANESEIYYKSMYQEKLYENKTVFMVDENGN